MAVATGILLCGVVASIDPDSPTVIGRITGLTGFGGERIAVDNIHNDLPNGWTQRLLSCIKSLKPFRISVVHDSNSEDWKDLLEQELKEMSIVWPVEGGYTTGGVYAFDGAVTDYTCGSGDIQSRVNGEFTITPSGEPEITPGTPAT